MYTHDHIRQYFTVGDHMAPPVGSSQTPPANSSLPEIPSTEPSHSLKRRLSASSDFEEASASKRQKTDDWMVLCENSGHFYPIPDETIHLMLSYCKASALVRIGTTCRRFLYLADRAPMWQELCQRAKLSVKEHASHRLEFLAAIAEENADAYTAKALFFTTDKYITSNQRYALAYLDHIINKNIFNDRSRFSQRQIDAVLEKERLFFNSIPIDRSLYSPGQISSLYEQLQYIITERPSQEKAAQACLYISVMEANDSQPLMITYSSIWYTFNSIRLNKKLSDSCRARAEYLLAVLPYFKENDRWEPADLAQFRQNGNELPDAEYVRILKKCLADEATEGWIHQLAKIAMPHLRFQRRTEEITDREAYQMLESLKNDRSLIPSIRRETLENLMQSFKDQKRI